MTTGGRGSFGAGTRVVIWIASMLAIVCTVTLPAIPQDVGQITSWGLVQVLTGATGENLRVGLASWGYIKKSWLENEEGISVVYPQEMEEIFRKAVLPR